jgi:hypothetical protein
VPVDPEQPKGYNKAKSDPRGGSVMSKQRGRASVVELW